MVNLSFGFTQVIVGLWGKSQTKDCFRCHKQIRNTGSLSRFMWLATIHIPETSIFTDMTFRQAHDPKNEGIWDENGQQPLSTCENATLLQRELLLVGFLFWGTGEECPPPFEKRRSCLPNLNNCLPSAHVALSVPKFTSPGRIIIWR